MASPPKILTQARDLQRRKARERHDAFVAEGIRTVEALLASPLTVRALLASPAAETSPRGGALVAQAEQRGIPVERVGEREFASAADTDAPQGVLAIADVPRHRLPLPASPTARYLVLDGVQDPGNVGTIIRTAAALGVTATVALPGTADLWNAKVVRSAMGALFHHPALALPWDEMAAFAAAHGVACWAADGGGVPVDTLVGTLGAVPVALVMGNEGAGVSAEVARGVPQRVAIRMAPTVESLNVAVAAGILLHALRAPAHVPSSVGRSSPS
ncbi:MAG: RNA methyltransferase [Gemmatimonadetes bacterium]|nr:RNA methyltransferase [Gemmatimonadota bacterium]